MSWSHSCLRLNTRMAPVSGRPPKLKNIYIDIYIHIMDSGNSSNDTQCISRPFTPKKGHHSARFEKTSKIKKTTRELFSKGYKIGQRKLNYEDSYEEKEPPKKRALRLSRVSNLRCSGYLPFSVLGRQKLF